jgi:group I intron endonuclease
MKYMVYKIKNTIDGKVYIGATKMSLKKRMFHHKHKGKKGITPLYLAIKEYGFENFKPEVVGQYSTEKEMHENEIKFIAEFKSAYRDFGYNISTGGKGPNGCKHSAETIAKIKKARLNYHQKPHTQETKNKIGVALGRKVVKYTLDKVLVDEFNSIEDASKSVGSRRWEIPISVSDEVSIIKKGFLFVIESESKSKRVAMLKNQLLKKESEIQEIKNKLSILSDRPINPHAKEITQLETEIEILQTKLNTLKSMK